MKFQPFTQKIQITKARNFEKMAGDEAFLMTSLVLIFVRPIGTSISVNTSFGWTVFAAFPGLVEDAGEDDVLRRDVAGINCRAFVLKSGYCGFCIPPP